MMKFAVAFDAPVAIRYPRGEAYAGLKEFRAPVELGKAELIYAEGDICLLAVGSMVKTAEEVRDILNASGYKCSIVNARFVKPIDLEAVKWASVNHKLVVSMEENVASGGYGEKVREAMDDLAEDTGFLQIAIPDEYVEHGNVEQLKQEIGMDAKSIADRILEEMESGR